MPEDKPNIVNTYAQMNLLLQEFQENKKQEDLEELALNVKISEIVKKAIEKNNEDRDKNKKWWSSILEKLILTIITAVVTAAVIKGLDL